MARKLILPGNPPGHSYPDSDLRWLDIYLEKENIVEILRGGF